MSDISSYYRKSMVSPAEERVDDFQPERFTELERADPIPDPQYDFRKDEPPKGAPPDPFEEFKVDQKPISSLMEDMPSLGALFQPFDLEKSDPVDDKFHEHYKKPPPPEDYLFEEMDTRDPEIVRALKEAREESIRLLREAEEKAVRLLDSAKTESRALLSEARDRAAAMEQEAQKEAESRLVEAKSQAEEIMARAKAFEEGLKLEKETAQAAVAQAAEEVKAAQAQVAGLDEARQQLQADLDSRRQQLETQYAELKKNLEDSRLETLKKAGEQGLAEGTAKGLKDGFDRAYREHTEALQKEADGFIEMAAKVDGLYQQLWEANGPMMIKLAIEGVEKILNQSLENGEELARGAFLAAIDFLSQAHNVTFLARPEDIAQLEKLRVEQRQRLGALVKIDFKPDPSLGPGDLIMESDAGRLDATVKHRAAQVLKGLREGFNAAYGDWEQELTAQAVQPPQEDQPQDMETEVLEENPAEEASAAEPEALQVNPEPSPGADPSSTAQ